MSGLLARVMAALDASDDAALAAIDAELEETRRRVGDYCWIGDICLQCVEVDKWGSHLEGEVARATAERSATGILVWWWGCPACGMTCCYPGESVPASHDPRCDDCRCPPTLRDPGLPPTARDGCAGAAGDANSRE